MNRVGALLETRTPAGVRKMALWALFRATARAFDRPLPPLRGLAADECLRCYAQFSADQAKELLSGGGDLLAVRERLYANAYRLGRACRWAAGVRSVAEALAVARLLYRWLEIDFQGDPAGGVVISRCYFRPFYSTGVCGVMSAMDSGLLVGLSGGRGLAFSARITAGHARCLARLEMEEAR